jgi:hypothetical protein
MLYYSFREALREENLFFATYISSIYTAVCSMSTLSAFVDLARFYLISILFQMEAALPPRPEG